MKTIKNFTNFEGSSSSLKKIMLAAIIVAGVFMIDSCRKTDDVSLSNTPAVQAGRMVTQEGSSSATPYSAGLIVASGILADMPAMTTYQYGSYELIIPGSTEKYALRSETLNLGAFVNKIVELKGYPIEGYPVDGGPVFLNVTQVRELVITIGEDPDIK